MSARSAGWVLLFALWLPGARGATPVAAPLPDPPAATRSGREIYQRFHDGLADPECEDAGSLRFTAHFAAAPGRLAGDDDQTLALFGYVVDALRAASLPTEYALIPFVESGYRPDARSPGGTAGLWQMIAVTARNHDVPMVGGYDGRLSPVDSTAAAVRYLKTLHGMFAGDWRLAVMAYNAGEYRVLDALRRSGQAPAHADTTRLVGMPAITRDYLRKVHALSCLLDQADDRAAWLQAIDHPVPVLQAVAVSGPVRTLDSWAQRTGRDPLLVRRLNPAFAAGRFAAAGARILAPAVVSGMGDVARADAATPVPLDPDAPFMAMARLPEALSRPAGPLAPPAPPVKAAVAVAAPPPPPAAATPAPVAAAMTAAAAATTHTVLRGESAWTIARRYGLRVEDLLARNNLLPRSVLRPGTVLKIALAGE
jgi:membrane-bound lytic murein transglycosylase D